MSTRAHFWFRVVAIAAIMLAQFGPRLWSGSPMAASAATTSGRVVAESIP